MLTMLVKMSAVTAVYVVLTFYVWKSTKDRDLSVSDTIAIGALYGIMSIMSTHFGIDYGDMMLNVRDLGPMSAGLFFAPFSGIIAGIIGGVERYIAGTYFGVGEFTRIACSISTILAGFLAAFLRVFIFKNKKPSIAYAFFMGSVIEVFHMYVVFLTHRDDIDMALYVVRKCSIPMIIFSGLGLAAISLAIKISCGEWHNPLKPLPKEEVPVSNRFQIWLFGVTVAVLALNFGSSYMMQTQSSLQDAKIDMTIKSLDIGTSVSWIRDHGGSAENFSYHVGVMGTFYAVDNDGNLLVCSSGEKYTDEIADLIATHNYKEYFTYDDPRKGKSLCFLKEYDNDFNVLVIEPYMDIYESRDEQAYETMLADILLFTVIYVLISLLVQAMVVDNLVLVNKSLAKITDGDLEEQVTVYESSEFASLSDDINQTVFVLKGYIAAAEKRIEQELLLAKTIQESALPRNFDYSHGGFEIFATMDPAKKVGGDFYDFFFVDTDKVAMVIADVSGKGIPAALFMMRSKTAIRSLAETGNELSEIFAKVNNELCEGNEINMFVTVWMGIIDLKTGDIKCINAGHEYPALMHKGGDYELLKDKHRPPLGVMEDLQYEEYELHLDPEDCLYVYTDGIPDAINLDEKQYGTGRMLTALNAFKDTSMEGMLAAVKSDIDAFVGEAEQFDDITMIGFRYAGPEKKA